MLDRKYIQERIGSWLPWPETVIEINWGACIQSPLKDIMKFSDIGADYFRFQSNMYHFNSMVRLEPASIDFLNRMWTMVRRPEYRYLHLCHLKWSGSIVRDELRFQERSGGFIWLSAETKTDFIQPGHCYIMIIRGASLKLRIVDVIYDTTEARKW